MKLHEARLQEELARGSCARNLCERFFRGIVMSFPRARNLRKLTARAVCLREVELHEAQLREEVARGGCARNVRDVYYDSDHHCY